MASVSSYIVYWDMTNDKVGAIEDDHLGIADMIAGRSDYKIMGWPIVGKAQALAEAIQFGKDIQSELIQAGKWEAWLNDN